MLMADIGARLSHGASVFADWLPRLVGALAVLIIAWLIAKLVGRLVARILNRAGFDAAMHRGSVGQYIEKVTVHPSGFVGRLAYWAVLLSGISLAVSPSG